MNRPTPNPEAWAIDVSTPMLVLRMDLAEFQHGVLAIARSAGRLGIPVHAVRRGPLEPATRSRYIAGGFQMPPDSSEEAWLEVIVRNGRRLGRPVLVPIDDKAAVFVADHRRELAERFLFPDPPAQLTRRLVSKRELFELCHLHGIRTPASAFPADRRELLDQADAFGYPVVLKRSEPWLPSHDPHAPSACLVRSRVEAGEAYARMESPLRAQVMVQEYIPGGSDASWMFDGYFDADSTCVCWFTGRKLRQYYPVGATTLGVCRVNPEVAELAQGLMGGLGYRGIVDMGFRYDARDASYKLVDVNPRIGCTFRLFVGDNGLDVLRALYFDLTGQGVSPARLVEGRKWIVEAGDASSAVRLARERALSLPAWLRSVRGIDEAAWWAADDPVPLMAMCARAVPYAYSRRRRAHRLASKEPQNHC